MDVSESSYDFICREWPDIPVINNIQNKTKNLRKNTETADIVDASDQEKASSTSNASEVRERSPLSIATITRFQKPIYESMKTREENFDETCFSPSSLKVSKGHDLEQGQNQENFPDDHSCEEDGFYVGERADVKQSNLIKMINRLSFQERAYWLNNSALLAEKPVEDVFYKGFIPRHNDNSEECPVKFVEATASGESNQDDYSYRPNEWSLSLKISGIKFHHHHLMSVEEQKVHNLNQFVEIYSNRMKSRETELLWDKIKVLRNSMRLLETSNIQKGTSVKKEIDYNNRSRLYWKSMKVFRDQLHNSAAKDREVLSNALTLWNDIKELRISQGYSITSVNLLIRKQKMENISEEEKSWIMNQEMEVNERLCEEKIAFKESYRKYKKDLSQWRKKHKSKKEAMKRHMSREYQTSKEESQSEALCVAADELTLAEPDTEKPCEPEQPMTEKEIQDLVREIYLKNHRPPNEPVIVLQLTQTNDNKNVLELPLQEKRRRQHLQKTKLSLKVSIDKKFVTQTSWAHLSPEKDFTAPVTLHSNITVPQNAVASLQISIIEGYNLSLSNTSELAKIKIPIALTARENTTDLKFSSKKTFSFSHSAIGSLVPDDENGETATHGSISLSYEVKASDSSAVYDNETNVLVKSFPNVTNSSSGLVDPNDPSQSHLPSSGNDEIPSGNGRIQEKELHDDDYFECDGESLDLLWFCTRKELDSNMRLKMLKLRDQKVPEFQRLSRIPSLSSQILRSTLQNYERKQSSTLNDNESLESRDEGAITEADDFIDEVTEKLVTAERLVSSIRKKLLQFTAEAAAVPKYSDMVREEQIPDIGTLGISLVSIFRPKERPLRPDRLKRGAVRGVGLPGQQVKLIVNVARAINVPVRSDQEFTDDVSNDIVRPFVTVSFQGKKCRTSVADGPNPTWNQQLTLPFKAPNDDYSSSSLGFVKDNITLQLFDEKLIELPIESPSKNDTSFQTRLHNTWLASLVVPATALLKSSKVEGTFELSSPTQILGYTRASENTNNKSTSTNYATHLTVYITLEPTLPHPQSFDGLLPSTEPDNIIKSSNSWNENLRNKYPSRQFNSHVLDTSGHLVSLNRYIRPLEPPVELLNETTSELNQSRIAWYVSLIASLPDMTLFPGTPNVTANSHQFVNILCGGEAERAHLLVNYYLFLNLEAYLIIGSSVSQSVYNAVLVKSLQHQSGRTNESKNVTWKIWCPETGNCYSTKDPFCPLKSIHMLVSQENIWGNVQKWDDPSRVQFQLNDSSCWKQFYSKSLPKPNLPSLQPSSLSYQTSASFNEREFRDRILIILRDSFMKWRPHHRTIWNRHASEVLRGVIRRLETPSSTGSKNNLTPPPNLTKLHQSHSVCGVCIHQGWHGISSLLSAVLCSDIHACQLPTVEFAMAVHTHTYPNNVTSIWVYVASLIRKTQL